MKRTSTKISVLVGGVSAALMLVFMAVFAVGMNWQIDANARDAINQTVGSDALALADDAAGALAGGLGDIGDGGGARLDSELDEAYETTLYYANEISYSSSATASELREYCTTREIQLIDWCRQNDASAIAVAHIGDYTYYVQSIDDSVWYADEAAMGDGADDVYAADERLLVYVNVTGELAMIPQFLVFFAVVAIIVGVLGSVVGYRLGLRIEHNERAQRTFFENTSHELKTPLTAIRGYGEGIETGVITDYQRTGSVIVAQTDKMTRLVDEILTQAKLESGSVELVREPVDIDELLEDCLMPFEGSVASKGLVVDLALEPLSASADRDRLEHAISNLFTNAVRYARSTVRVACGGKLVRIFNDCDPLSPSDLAHLFDRFYTGEGRTAENGGSTGIGLAIAKEIIVLHGWTIEACNVEGGIEFVITIP